MEEETDLEEVETPAGEEPEPAPDQSAAYWKARAEKAERKWRRSTEFSKLQAKYPGVSEEDLAGVDVRHWERIAARIAPQQPIEAEPEPEKLAPEVKEAARQFVQGAGGSGPAATEKITFEEAKRLGGPANPQVYELLKKGLVEGVKPPK